MAIIGATVLLYLVFVVPSNSELIFSFDPFEIKPRVVKR
jgi:hypothetical protein